MYLFIYIYSFFNSEMVMSQTAELRKCTTLFIKIKVNVNLYMGGIKKGVETGVKGLLPFIHRSKEEMVADAYLLNDLQGVYMYISIHTSMHVSFIYV
jgi:hypothetical protein